MTWRVECEAFLFDMDGTLVDSTPLIERIWRGWAARRDIDVDYLLQHIHGRRGVETIRLVAPHLDAESEVRELLAEEMADMTGVTAIPGAADFVARLHPAQWAIVTSAPRDIALAKLRVAGVPQPQWIIAADDVDVGKPHPEPYLKGAALLGKHPAQCVAFEDAQSGIHSAHQAGMPVVVITHAAGADITGLASVQIGHYNELQLSHANGQLQLARERVA